MKQFFSSILNISILLLFAFSLPWAALTVASCLYLPPMGNLNWNLDLYSHFKIQYTLIQIGLLVFFALCLLRKNKHQKFLRLAIGFNLSFLLINVGQLYPYYATPQPNVAQQASAKARFRVLHINVLWKNERVDLVKKQIREANADIVSLQEYRRWWRNHLDQDAVLKAYPYRYLTPSGDDGLYSRIPFESVRSEYIPHSPEKSDVAIVARFKMADKPITLLFSHPPTPMAPFNYGRQKWHFQFWSKNRRSYGENFAVIGDLNTSPWSVPIRRFLQETGLRDSQIGFGIQRSFPTYDFRKGIPIDHCLVSKNFIVLNRQLGQFVGSDHLPIIVDLALK